MLQKKNFLLANKDLGGGVRAFRRHIEDRFSADRPYFAKLQFDALMESTTKAWERPARKVGPDLFSVAGYTIPEFLTRPASGYVDGDDVEEDEEAFEKVDAQFATVQDLMYDAMIKLRKAAQAEREMRAVDDARRLARGNMAMRLHDMADVGGKAVGAHSDAHPAP
jgi:hypothetical protein